MIKLSDISDPVLAPITELVTGLVLTFVFALTNILMHHTLWVYIPFITIVWTVWYGFHFTGFTYSYLSFPINILF